MLAVSDTSPVSNLASIGRLDLIKSQFSTVWVPAAVASELAEHPDPAARLATQDAIREQWLRIGNAEESPMLQILLLQLHRGEAEAIALALSLKSDMVLIDELEGRQIAAKAGLAVTGVLGILLRAKQRGEIKAIKPEINLLRSKAHFFISRILEAGVLAAAGE